MAASFLPGKTDSFSLLHPPCLLLSSSRSAGKVLKYKGQDVTVELTTEDSFEGVDIALFSAGGSVSAKFAPYAVKAGAVVSITHLISVKIQMCHLLYLKSMLTL